MTPITPLDRVPRSTAWLRSAAAIGTTAALLAGCGGGGGVDVPLDPRAVPASATTSVRAWTEYTGSLLPNDDQQGLSVDGVEPPVSESANPLPVS